MIFSILIGGRIPYTEPYSLSEECKNYIRRHALEKVTVTQAAKALNVNPGYLERVFRKSEGIPVHTFIQEEKVRRSQFFLAFTDRTLAEISEYVGFSSQSHFSRLFRQVTGKTPREFRAEHHRSSF